MRVGEGGRYPGRLRGQPRFEDLQSRHGLIGKLEEIEIGGIPGGAQDQGVELRPM